MIAQILLGFALYSFSAVKSRWPKKRLVLGHRGARAQAPENTLESFKLAFDLGAHGIEFDVYLSKDKVPFVIHDDTLERTTDGHGEAEDKSMAQLKELDAARGWPDFAGAKLPTLKETLEAMPDQSFVNIELKGEGKHSKDEFVKTVLEVMNKHRERLFIVVSSFDSELLEMLRAQDPRVSIGLLLNSRDPTQVYQAIRRMKAISPAALHLPPSLASKWIIRLAHSKGLRVMIWTVNDKGLAVKLFAKSVDGIFSDFPQGFAWE